MTPVDPPSLLWTLRKDDHETTCQVRLMPHGIEVDLLRDGRLLTTRAFDTGDEALAWAEAKRLARSTAGWTSTS